MTLQKRLYAIYSEVPAAVDTIKCGDDLISYTALANRSGYLSIFIEHVFVIFHESWDTERILQIVSVG